MLNKIRQFIKPRYKTLNVLEIKRQFILDNYRLLKSYQKEAAIFPVLKSNAYGHGLKEMCLILNDSEAPYVVVDSFPEAQTAYKYFKRKVLILGEMPAKTYSYCNLKRSEFCIYNRQSLEVLSKIGRAKVHLFINSGMNREGIKDIASFLTDNRDLLSKVEVTGFCSHLAAAEEGGESTQKQLAKFLSDLDILKGAGYNPKWIHLGNSAAIFNLQNKNLTAFRSGLSLYGYSPFGSDSAYYSKAQELKPALRLTSTIVSIQSLNASERVSYNGTYEMSQAGKIAVIPFGYYEGLPRSLSNLASFAWLKSGQKHYLKIAGRVCMNLCCLDASNLEVETGDDVEIISLVREDKNSLENLANISGHITYELLVGLQSNIRRVII